MSLAAYALGLTEADIRKPERGSGQAAFARQVAMYMAHVALEMSLARAAVVMGRDRSTVAHACHVMEDPRDEARFDMWMAALEESARAAPGPLRRDWPSWRKAAAMLRAKCTMRSVQRARVLRGWKWARRCLSPWARRGGRDAGRALPVWRNAQRAAMGR